ncbi:MAG TPA: hypothetical protein VKO18_06375 [Terriglobia bacterium]|nr:hypothetical protein [Terriglobia bacterium]
MVTIGLRRVALGTLAGGVVWGIWSTIINMVILPSKYQFAQAHQLLLTQPRYPLFVVYWFVTLFLLTYILTWVYASARATLGPGPITALRVGLLVGFAMSFPLSLSMAAWAPFSRGITLGWMLDLWVGSILATLVSAWLYKES